MLRTLKNLFKQDREKFVVPKSVQNVIPIKTIWDDGIFLVGRNKYAKTFKFEDINYAVASREDKEAMFLEYSELLNSLDSGATTKITINNRRLNKADFEQTILIPMADDGLDKYRKEYNKMLLDKATGANSIVQDKYVTVSVCKKNIEEARNYFARVGADLIAHFNRLGSKCVELDAGDKLRIFHDFYRTGEETAFHFDITQTMRKGHDFKDFICPDTFEFESDCFRMGDRYGRVIFLREYAAYIKDSMVAELCELNRNMMLSVDIIPVPTDEAVREVENRLLGVETNITNWQRKQNQNNNFSAVIPYDLEQQRKESKEFLDDLTTRDQRMMFAVLTMVHTADTKEQLDNDTEALLTTARKHLCQFAVLKYQQMDGLNTALPFGVRKIDALRTLTTESLAVFIPFRVQEIYHENGVYYGQNVISKNMIIANRRQLLNGNSFILGVSGAGKSFTAKEEMTNIILTDPNADIIIIDPEREYSPLVKAMQGEVIHISATSENHINAIVSEELWQKAHTKRMATGIKQPSKIGKDRSHLLTGILKCPLCGSSMYTNKHAWTNKDGTYKEVYYYICGRNKQERGHHCDYKASLRKTDIEPLVIEAVKELVSDKYFAKEIEKRIGVQTDTTAIDKELANYESKLKEVDLNKARLEREIDNLPVDTRFRERKIHDMTLRLDALYDTIVELEERIEDAKLRKSSIEMETITLDNIYKLMLNFGKLYDIISDEEKKSLITYLIKEIQIYPNGESEQPLKSIEFNFPIYRDGQEVRRLLWEKGNTVETVMLLCQQKPDDYIDVELDLDELDATSAETKATYQEIKEYVLKHRGFNVSSLYIAQVKRKLGLEVGESYNKPKSLRTKTPVCPPNKESAIIDALKHFGMI